MACANSISIPGLSICIRANNHTANSPLCQSHSAKDLFKKSMMRRSSSENSLRYAINRARATSTSSELKLKNSHSVGILHIPGVVKSFLFEPEKEKDDYNASECSEEKTEADTSEEVEKRNNWIRRLMEIRSRWRNPIPKEDSLASSGGDNDLDECEVEYNDEEEHGDGSTIDEEFADFLEKVGLSDTKLFSQLAFLSNMACVIPQMKAKNLRRYYLLRFITSSLEKKAEAAAIKSKIDEDSTRVPVVYAPEEPCIKETVELEKKRLKDPSVMYGIAASAVSYAKTRSKGKSSNGYEPQLEDAIANQKQMIDGLKRGASPSRVKESDVAAFVAASTMTAVIAAGENEKMEAAKDLQSLQLSPCEWFVCDDYSTYTRCFVIQTRLVARKSFFEPTKFENSDVLVHRGIYEAAKGIYKQFLPEIDDHIQRFGDRAKLQFNGHSLGGSLSLLVSLMLISRKVVKPSMLRPAVTFGSPFIFCGGQKLLNELGINEIHVHSVMMHRDIVPRAFSCIYPDHVAQLLKKLHSPFKTHPCLNKHKLLYAPLGKTFIIQPDEQSSPPHPLLPQGSAFYYLDKTKSKYTDIALRKFLSSPHPLETLSDPAAYGSKGTILRDHDSSNYLKAVNWVLRKEKRLKDVTDNLEKNIKPNLVPPASMQRWNRGGDTLRHKRLISAEVDMCVS